MERDAPGTAQASEYLIAASLGLPSAFLDFFNQGGNHRIQIPYNAVIRNVENRRIRVFIDGYNGV